MVVEGADESRYFLGVQVMLLLAPADPSTRAGQLKQIRTYISSPGSS